MKLKAGEKDQIKKLSNDCSNLTGGLQSLIDEIQERVDEAEGDEELEGILEELGEVKDSVDGAETTLDGFLK